MRSRTFSWQTRRDQINSKRFSSFFILFIIFVVSLLSRWQPSSMMTKTTITKDQERISRRRRKGKKYNFFQQNQITLWNNNGAVRYTLEEKKYASAHRHTYLCTHALNVRFSFYHSRMHTIWRVLIFINFDSGCDTGGCKFIMIYDLSVF